MLVKEQILVRSFILLVRVVATDVVVRIAPALPCRALATVLALERFLGVGEQLLRDLGGLGSTLALDLLLAPDLGRAHAAAAHVVVVEVRPVHVPAAVVLAESGPVRGRVEVHPLLQGEKITGTLTVVMAFLRQLRVIQESVVGEVGIGTAHLKIHPFPVIGVRRNVGMLNQCPEGHLSLTCSMGPSDDSRI